MTGLPVPAWLVVAVVVAAAAAIILIVLKQLALVREEEANWRPVPGFLLKYDVRGAASETRIAQCLGLAIDALTHNVGWTRDQILIAITGFQISVTQFYRWTSSRGETVGGETSLDLGRILVGADLAGLCHELAHVCEDRLEHKVDYAHAGWPKKGIFLAVDEYMAKL